MSDIDAVRWLDPAVYAAAFWDVPAKAGGYKRFIPQPGQARLFAACAAQFRKRGYVRLNVLKCRQVGGTTANRILGMHRVVTRPAHTALTIAHDEKLPTQWLTHSREMVQRSPSWSHPPFVTAQGNLLRFANGSRYSIGSAQGGFTGVGDTIHFLHVSELGRWDKPPISVSPENVLQPLTPAIPTGDYIRGTMILRESTGVMRGDYWWKCWQAGKAAGEEFENLFLPWFLVPEYRREDMAGEIISLSEHEQGIVTAAAAHGVALDHAQLAWRRVELRSSPWFGNEAPFDAEYPATEEEAFMSPGQALYTDAEVALARNTVRKPVWVGNLLGDGCPDTARLAANDGGELRVWAWPDERYHYVLGGDCMWGKGQDSDFDSAFVECLETREVCAKVKGRYQMPVWAWKMAALGHKYNLCPLAPERNWHAGADADGVMATLLGNVTAWKYPNVWIRSDDLALRGHRLEDYGWQTDRDSKLALIAYSEEATLAGTFDWADENAVDEMSTIVHHLDKSPGAPEGMHDDDWMARLITGYVAHRLRPRTSLYREPGPRLRPEQVMTPVSARLRAMLGPDELPGESEA